MECESPKRELRVFPNLEELSDHAANLFVRNAQKAVKTESRFTVCLSGGSTPRRLYALLAQHPVRDQVPWQQVHIFWGDERCVPLSSPDNHFAMTSELLLNKVPIPADNIHRMRGESPDPETAAKEYEAELSRFFRLGPSEFPCFDLIFLGMGDDGHTASLYPGTPALQERERLVVAQYVPQRENYRLTLTFPVINSARRVVFLVAGAEKANALHHVLEGNAGFDRPASLVKLSRGNVVWLVDRLAANINERSRK